MTQSNETRVGGDATAREALRVLLVDDDGTFARVLREVLRTRLPLAEVEICDTAGSALAKAATRDFHVVVTDYVLPDFDGVELLEKIRTVLPECAAVLITGRDERELTLQALRAGVYDFIQKPVDPDYFAACVRRAAEACRLRRAVFDQQEALRLHADRLEGIVAERTRELLEANRVKDEFLATVSHELRTPLTAIVGWARLLRAGTLESHMRGHALDSLARNAESQARLIDDLLDISRIMAGKLRMSDDLVDVRDVVEGACAAVEPAISAKKLGLRCEFSDGPLEVRGDGERLSQVFWNLLSNAVKFTPEGGTIVLSAQCQGSLVTVTVQDSGVGIDAEFLPRVFDRFHQAEKSVTSSRRGLGLGLAISRHIVELHHGEVQAASDGAGKGSTFTVCLPRLVSRVDGLTPSETYRAAAADADLEGVNVLVVDDEVETLQVLVTLLVQQGAEVRHAASAREAWEAIRAWPPDILLCDIGLPDEDGYCFLRRVRGLSPREGGLVPAVALTAYAQSDDRDRALAAGFDLHVAKPGPADLPRLLAGVLARRDDGHAA